MTYNVFGRTLNNHLILLLINMENGHLNGFCGFTDK